MFKIYWLLKRAEGLSVEDFSDWWLNHHAPYIAARQGRFLARYSVNLALPDEGSLPAGTGVESDWDGLAEEIFHSVEDARAALAYPRPRKVALMYLPMSAGFSASSWPNM